MSEHVSRSGTNRNRGYYLSFSKPESIAWKDLGLEELRAAYSQREEELAELRLYNRALSDTLWQVSRHPGQEGSLEERLTQQSMQIDRLQNQNHALSETITKLKGKLNACSIALKQARQGQPQQAPASRVATNTIPDINDIVIKAKAEVSAHAKLLASASSQIEALRQALSKVDRLFDQQREAIDKLNRIESELQTQQEPLKTGVDDSAAQAEVANLRLAVQNYFFQFAGSAGNGGTELELLTKRAEPLSRRPHPKTMEH